MKKSLHEEKRQRNEKRKLTCSTLNCTLLTLLVVGNTVGAAFGYSVGAFAVQNTFSVYGEMTFFDILVGKYVLLILGTGGVRKVGL